MSAIELETRDQLLCWQSEAQVSGQTMGTYLRNLLIHSQHLLPKIAHVAGLHPLTAEQCQRAQWNFDQLSLVEALHEQALWLELDEVSYLLVSDPLDRAVRQWLQNRFPGIYQALSIPGVLESLLRQAESQQKVMEGMSLDLGDDSLAKAVESISLTTLAKDESPVIRLLNMTLYDGLQNRASDIHLEAYAAGLLIRYRIDGVLQTIREVPAVTVAQQLMSRLKVLSSLDIAEKRVPQDGRFSVVLQGREVDFRVSIMPGIYGENAVLRLLDKSQRSGVQLDLTTLGFDAVTAGRIRKLAAMPYGLTLITGPTGSGKSTTLYGLLAELHTGEDKIITIEDPVEYEMEGILQIPVNDKKGLTFSRGLRSILRHDPDTILVGEIRDAETAAIAVQSALTGHRVLSSVHANDAFSVIDRFIYMGVEATTFLESLNGVVSQRLVRKRCISCSPIEPDKPGSGCEACRYTGYSGRTALAEVLRLDDAIKSALLTRNPQQRKAALHASKEYQSLEQAAQQAVAQGLTTLQEVSRAVALS